QAQDDAGGSGIQRVQVYLLRRVGSSTNYEYWHVGGQSHATWSSVSRPMVASLSAPGAGSTNWSVSSGLPTNVNLPVGT
ncbi:hypothetical protein, partial [Enterobacter hormaechei]|uniref:hypothetical protein n=1 Tax=Enterobacter hormaechei TaxID=158836 RepID=UPI003C2E6144